MYLKEPCIHKIIIEKSEFICYLRRCDNVDDFKEFVSAVKKKHYDATHNCSAFISKDIKRSNDDGEPSGTAGAPMLNALEKREMEDTACVVTRYFGGIKLGAGGLIRAYSKAVLEALDEAKLINLVSFHKYELSVPYDIANKLDYFLRSNTNIIDTIYDIDVKYIYTTNDNLDNTIMEYTKGIKAKYIEDVMIEVDVK